MSTFDLGDHLADERCSDIANRLERSTHKLEEMKASDVRTVTLLEGALHRIAEQQSEIKILTESVISHTKVLERLQDFSKSHDEIIKSSHEVLVRLEERQGVISEDVLEVRNDVSAHKDKVDTDISSLQSMVNDLVSTMSVANERQKSFITPAQVWTAIAGVVGVAAAGMAIWSGLVAIG